MPKYLIINVEDPSYSRIATSINPWRKGADEGLFLIYKIESDSVSEYQEDGELDIVRLNPDHTVSQFLGGEWVEVKKQDPSSSEPEGEFD